MTGLPAGVRSVALSGGWIGVAALLWWTAPFLLEWAGLDDFGLAGRLCLTIAGLSIADTAVSRWWGPVRH
jgi:hypothetical protein